MQDTQRRVARTPYGEPSGALTFGRIAGGDVVFLARHGYGHTIAPHEVNYRANLWALKDAGASAVVSVASVGGIGKDMGPGRLAVPHQIIDYTWGRASTYFEGASAPVNHIDFTEPYSESLRQRILAAARAAGEPVIERGVYAATQGPRLETAAEIDRLERDGADLVGMTGMPEASLAREISLEYAAIAVVANYAAGRAESQNAVPLDRIGAVLEEAMGRVRRIIEQLCAP
jgi:5'-methylthioadenosine phosphorylase